MSIKTWATLFKVGMSAVKGTFQLGSKAISLTGLALKNTGKIGAMGAAGYAVTHDDPWGDLMAKVPKGGLAKMASDLAFGKSASDQVQNVGGQILDKVENLVTPTQGTSTDQSSQASNTQSNGVDGMQNFLGNMFNGNGTSMFGSFLNNLFSGNVSVLSTVGIVAGLWMMFGRFGMFGRIGGALLSMLLIGNNSQSVTPSLQASQAFDRNRSQMTDGTADTRSYHY